MKPIKSIIILIFCLLPLISFSQILKFKTTHFTARVIDSLSGKWGEWSQTQKSEMLVVIDGKKEQITIFSNNEQVYDVAVKSDPIMDSLGNRLTILKCIDNTSNRCVLNLVKTKDDDIFLYIIYKNAMWGYVLKPIE